MKIQILGPECAKCAQLTENATAAAKELGFTHEIENVRDWSRIKTFGAVIPPGLVINGEVRSVGRVPSIEELKHMFDFVKRSLAA